MTGISVNHIGFALAGLTLITCAWSPWRAAFLPVFFVLSLGILGTWLRPFDMLALGLFLLPALLMTGYLWGHPERASGIVTASIVTYLLVLFVIFRRYPIFDMLEWMNHPVAIIGLSYMLFRVIHLVLEAPRMGQYPFGISRFVAYVTGFWTLLAGPIQRYDDFCTGLGSVGRPSDRDAVAAAHRLVNGLIQAFVLAPLFVEPANIDLLKAEGASAVDFLIVLYAFPIYLYLNFSGYTDAMIGLAGLCGVTTLPENFDRPYLSRNVQDFWSRWHMSFGVWIKHYLFMPLNKALLTRWGFRFELPATITAVMITFLLLGAWHGTNANFVVFGALHGIAVIGTGLYGGILKWRLGRAGRKAFVEHPAVRAVAIVLCFHYVAMTLMVFNNPLEKMFQVLKAFFG